MWVVQAHRGDGWAAWGPQGLDLIPQRSGVGTMPSCTRAGLPRVAGRGPRVKRMSDEGDKPRKWKEKCKYCAGVCKRCMEGVQRVCRGAQKGAQMGLKPRQSGRVEQVWWVQAQCTKRSKKLERKKKSRKCACFDRGYHEKST